MVAGALAPDLRKLIEAIEAWPTAVSAIKKAYAKPEPKSSAGASSSGAAAENLLADGAEDGDEEEDDEDAHSTLDRAPPPRPILKLTSSLRAPPTHRMSSMTSAVPQRDEEWRRSALGPSLGPGSYQTTIESVEVRDATRKLQIFRSDVPARPPGIPGRQGEPPLPDGLFAQTSSPNKSYSKVPGTTWGQSLGYRFDAAGYLQGVQLQQRPKKVHRNLQAPQWVDEPQPLIVPTDHAERLAAARASIHLP